MSKALLALGCLKNHRIVIRIRNSFFLMVIAFLTSDLANAVEISDKVFIVDKMVSNHTSRKTTRIIDAIAGKVGEKERYFVKMDIEGGERAVIAGNEDFFRENRVKLSCCVYHRQDDASVIRDMLERFGYKTRFSDGYMLVDMNGIHFPYFRHGVIYAWNH